MVIGSEGEGMARLARERCDQLLSLPMRGKVGSLNAAAALAAVLYAYVVPRAALSPDPRGVDSGPAGVAQSGSATDL